MIIFIKKLELVNGVTCITYCYVTICCCLLHSETDITFSLTGISPVLAVQIEELRLLHVSINSGCVEVLIDSLTSPHSCLLKLEVWDCTISSSDYCHLTTAIPTSNLTHFTTGDLGIDVSSAKGLARAMTQSKTLEEVEVEDTFLNNEVARILLEAMNHSSVKKLKIGDLTDPVSGCSYPTDKVEVNILSKCKFKMRLLGL